MIALVADENFNNRNVRGLIRSRPQIDIVRVQDVRLSGARDPEILAWAADGRRVVVTHDVSTMIGHARERIAANLPMWGVIECGRHVSIRRRSTICN